MNSSPFPHRKHQSGISILELMIAMAIGLIVIATIGFAYVGAKGSFRSQNASALIQENARYAFELIGNDLRLAGFVGGDTTGAVNVIATPTWDANLKDLFNLPLFGYEKGVDVFPAGITSLGDVLTVVHADTANEYQIAAQDNVAHNFTLATWPASNAPEAGEILVAVDPTQAAVFQATAVNPGSMTVSYATGIGTPGNTSTALGTFNAIASGKMFPLSGATYYIKTNPAGEPALYRQRLSHVAASATATVVNEELVEGVKDMQVTYGVDLTPTPDNSVDAYWTADAVTAGTDGANSMPLGLTTNQRWARVLSVRITLSMVSSSNVKVTPTGDGLLHKSFTTTLAIRNRLP